MDLAPSASAELPPGSGLPEHVWIQPVADARVMPPDGDPAELTAARESIRLAFIAALQHLPPRQRAVLILREVLRWQASEVAELLDTTVASVNSALQRARATLQTVDIEATEPLLDDARQRELLARYVAAFERYDVAALVTLLRDDVTFSMPPHELWLRGPLEVSKWLLGHGIGCKGSRLVPTVANGCPAFGSYRQAGPNHHEPFALQVVEISDGKIAGLHNFLYPERFPDFGLPPRLEN
jgi:RNA polymerase sigma-70 factor (ECF subfamily)